MQSDLLKLLPQFDVISFDVFDTLLVRNVLNPKDVWRIIGEESRSRESKSKNGGFCFFDARDAADRATYAAATARGGEHTLDEVYEMMGPAWAEWKQRELDEEMSCLFSNPEMVALWDEAGRIGKKRVIVSDMYLPQSEIERILRAKGIDGWNEIFVSSEHGCRKATGKLFEVMLKKMGTRPERVMHIGDNRESDFEIPQRLGMTAFLYPKIKDRFFEECPLAREFLSYGTSFERERVVGALAYGWHAFKWGLAARPESAPYHVESTPTFWNKIGFLYGGVLGYAYVDWIGRTAKKMGIDHLMFVGRDGYIWQKIAKILFPDLRSDYFYAPRTMSIRVLGAIGNDPGAVKDRQRYVDEFLKDNDSEKARAEYASYLAQFKIDPKKTALVDGMSSGFSAQRLVEKTVGAEVFTFYLLAFAPPKLGVGFYESQMNSISFQNFSEFIFGSPEPPLERVDANGAVFAQSMSVFEEMKIGVSEEICEGAVACVKALRDAMVSVSPQDWQDYFDAGMRTLTSMGRWQLEVARNSTDVAHRRYASIVAMPGPRWRTKLSILGIPVFRIRYEWRDGWFCRTLFFRGKIPLLTRKTKFYKLAEV